MLKLLQPGRLCISVLGANLRRVGGSRLSSRSVWNRVRSWLSMKRPKMRWSMPAALYCAMMVDSCLLPAPTCHLLLCGSGPYQRQ